MNRSKKYPPIAATSYELGIATSIAIGWTSCIQSARRRVFWQRDHRGNVGNEPIGALAHLQLGRAYATRGGTTKARAAYQDFLTLWKDADRDIPILKQAKAEYAKLQ